tara:strand:+ start:1614 stop:5702 length:4089 start_codon:yes stop_codon:yes gene_type:complete
MIIKISQWLMACVCILLLLIAISLSWLRLGVDDHRFYHQWVEGEVSRAIGQELNLESFQVKLVGTRLQLSLTGIEDLGGLTIARLALGIDLLGSLSEQMLRLSHVQASGLAINIEQENDGTWGPQATKKSGSQSVPQLLLAVAARVPQLLLNDVSLTLTPNQGQPFSFPKLNAQVHVAEKMGLDLTRINLSLHSTADIKLQDSDLETQVILDLKTNQTIGHPSNEVIQRAQIYVHSNGVELAPWLSFLAPPESSYYLDRLRLGGKYWLDYQANKHLQLVTQNTQLLLATPTDEIDFTGDIRATSQLEGLTSLDWTSLDFNLSVNGLSGQVNGATLPLSELLIQKTNQRLVIGSSKLHLADTQRLLNTIKSLPININRPIQSLAPTGLLHQVKLHLDVHQPKEFLFTGNMQQVSVDAWVGVPKISQADGQIWLNRYGGKVAIKDTDGLQLRITKLTSQPWQLSGLQGEFNWHYGALTNRFSSSNMHIGFDQGYMNLEIAAEFPRKGSLAEPFIQLALGMQNLNLAGLPSMLPDIPLGRGLGAWITTAAPMGTVTKAALIYNGRPGRTVNSKGVMTMPMARSMPIVAHVEVPSFSYHQDWPQVQSLKADLTVDHSSVLVDVLAGSFVQSDITKSVKGWKVEVPLYKTESNYKAESNKTVTASNTAVDKNRRYITVHGQIAGEASQIMTLAQELPLHLNLPSWLHAVKPQGDVSLQGSFGIPFGHQSKATYDLKLSSDDLSGYWEPLQANLSQVNLEVGLSSEHSGIGKITGNGLVDDQLITFNRLSKVDLAKPWLSQIPTKILYNINTNFDAQVDNLTLEFTGQLPAHYLATKLNQPWVQEISGQLPFVARFSTCTQSAALCTWLSAEVDLNQAGIDLPDPLNQLQQLQLLGNWQEDDQNWYASIDKHQVAVKLGANESINGLRVLGANASFNSAVDWAEQGEWRVGGQIDFVDLEPWLAVYQQRSKSWWLGADKKPTAVVLPQIEVKIKRATWQSLDMDHATITLQATSEGDLLALNPWRFRLTSEQLAGKVDYFGASHPLLVHIDHARLNFPELADDKAEDYDLLENIDPSKFPDADVSIDELVKNGESFGQWQFKTRRQGTQINVHDLDAYIRHSRLQGNLIWDKVDGSHRTQFTGRVSSNDIPSLLMDWGYGPALVAETSALEVQLDWPRSPAAFAVKDVSGDVGLRLKKGSFSSSPSAANGLRVLALFDMSRLMKRVQLDFSDVIQPGFSFDSVAVHYRFDDGVASTASPLTLKSTALNLTMDGWIDFNRREVNNNLIVTLPVVDKLPLVALIAGLPQLSGMIYVVNKLIGEELSTFTSARYSVQGSLDKPDVKLVRMFDKDYQAQSVQERIENVISIE